MGTIRVKLSGPDDRFIDVVAAHLTAQPAMQVVQTERSCDVHVVITPELGTAPAVDTAAPQLVLGPDNAEAMLSALDDGAAGYLSTDTSLAEITSAIEALSEGQAVVPPDMLGALLRHVVQRRRVVRSDAAHLDQLTPREREVFELMAGGMDRASIAEELFISIGTVRSHLQTVFRKLEVHSHAELVALANRADASDGEDR